MDHKTATRISKTTRDKALRELVALTDSLAERCAHDNPGTDMAAVAEATQDKILAAMQRDGFPWEDPARLIRRTWERELDEQRAARGGWQFNRGGDAMARAKRAVQHVRDSGGRPDVESAYRAGRELLGHQSAPSRETIAIYLTSWCDPDTLEDQPAAATVPEGFFVPFMPTAQTHRDIARLAAAREADPSDDGGVDCTRLDILAVLAFETRRNSRDRDIPMYPRREQKRLLAVDDAGLDALHAQLDLAIQTAREEVSSAPVPR